MKTKNAAFVISSLAILLIWVTYSVRKQDFYYAMIVSMLIIADTALFWDKL